MLARVRNKDAESVISALIIESKKLPSELYKSLTWDSGTGEMNKLTTSALS